MILSQILKLTIPCSDNGVCFTQTDRLDSIQAVLSHSEYDILENQSLARIYHHHHFQPDRPTILISTHIDSLYTNYYATLRDDELHGTFDNSACNAIVVEEMLADVLPPQVLISFTGDEEDSSQGAIQTVNMLKEKSIFDHLEMVITLDLTEAHYGTSDYTIENYFVERDNSRSLLRFGGKRDFKSYIREMIPKPVFIRDADPDESWLYDEYDLNCFSLCLPCQPLGENMHEDIGVSVLSESLTGYMRTLQQLSHSISADLKHRYSRG